MSAASPSPAPPLQTPSPNAQPPSSSTVPPPQQPMTPPLSSTSPPPPSTTSPPKQQPSSPTPSNSTSSPPTASPPPPTRLTPPPTVPLAPPPSQLAPPPSQSPPLSPPPVASPPTSPSRPPPPPSTSPTRGSPPPQSSVPPRSSPPPSTPPSPPSLSAPPPSNPAPPPASPPTENPPPPPAVLPPRRSPPPPPRNSTTTPPPASPPTENPPPPSPVPPPPRNSTSTPPRASPPVAVSPPPPRNSTSTPPRASPPVAVSPQPPSSPPSSIPPPTNSPPSPTTPSSQPAPPSKSTPSFQSAPPPLPRSLLSPPPPLPPQNRSENSSPESGSSGGIGTGAIVGIAVCGGILLLGFIGVALWCLNRQKRRNPPHDGYVMPFTLPSSTESDSSFLKKLSSAPLIKSDSGSDVVYTPSDTGGSGMGHSRNWFSYEELIKATNGFSTQNILGEGGFGFVYKGSLPDGREVAVKQLKHGGGQGEKEFKAEVEIISRIHHRHLVSLVGYCIQDNRRLLVYDYVPNNTLHFHLHGEGQPVLEWANRVKIAAGAARGIAYLHEDCNPRIIHRDIKTSNILLDYNYEAMVADFGLAKLVLDSYTAITTRVMGTFGYVAPEYAQSGKLTEKSDVYSFGVVLLELITGRKAVDESQPSGEDCLVEWARPLLSDALETQKFESLVDPKLEKNYVESEMFCMIQVAAVCVRHSASKRPNMGQVVRAFDGLAASDIMNGMRVGESQALNSTQQAQLRWFQRAAAGSFSNDLFSQESLHT